MTDHIFQDGACSSKNTSRAPKNQTCWGNIYLMDTCYTSWLANTLFQAIVEKLLVPNFKNIAINNSDYCSADNYENNVL